MSCSYHFREAREDFYYIKQKPGEYTTTFYSCIIELYKLAEFPDNSDFLIVDKLIHGCANEDCKCKLMGQGKTFNVKVCLETLQQHEAVDVTMKRLWKKSDLCHICLLSNKTKQNVTTKE